MTRTVILATLMGVFGTSLPVVARSGVIAANRAHSGGISTAWLLVIIIAALIIVAALLRRRSEPQPDEETLRANDQDALERGLGPLPDSDCRYICFWLARSSRSHQQALYEAMEGIQSYESPITDEGASAQE
jgi:hypothetical protein